MNIRSTSTIECGDKIIDDRQVEIDASTVISMRRIRTFKRQACLLSVMAAFIFGLALGVLVPMIGLGSTATTRYNMTNKNFLLHRNSLGTIDNIKPLLIEETDFINSNKINFTQFPIIYDIQQSDQLIRLQDPISLVSADNGNILMDKDGKKTFQIDSFIDKKLLRQMDINDPNNIIIYPLKSRNDRNLPKTRQKLQSKMSSPQYDAVEFVKKEFANIDGDAAIKTHPNNDIDQNTDGIIENGVYWSRSIEMALPKGFDEYETDNWNKYVNSNVIQRLEIGCGRMQNRMIYFSDGTKACGRYRQNTDQIQGELFSFYLGQLLNITNLAPSAVSLIDFDSKQWQLALPDITTAQWKTSRPVVLTKWLPDLEPAGIPMPFQTNERHLNRDDIRTIRRELTKDNKTRNKGLLSQLGVGNTIDDYKNIPSKIIVNGESLSPTLTAKLIELAQWSDLIIFDYLIANLDRVVNNLYNFQWNADIMAAPAHNLARKSGSQLLVFLDNESGLLHGYRLLKKYETYHGLLLDNLCLFRRPTIDALKNLRGRGVGHRIQRLFEKSTNNKLRDILPPLPEKSIKILVDRIDRVLGQVQKCRDYLTTR